MMEDTEQRTLLIDADALNIPDKMRKVMLTNIVSIFLKPENEIEKIIFIAMDFDESTGNTDKNSPLLLKFLKLSEEINSACRQCFKARAVEMKQGLMEKDPENGFRFLPSAKVPELQKNIDFEYQNFRKNISVGKIKKRSSLNIFKGTVLSAIFLKFNISEENANNLIFFLTEENFKNFKKDNSSIDRINIIRILPIDAASVEENLYQKIVKSGDGKCYWQRTELVLAEPIAQNVDIGKKRKKKSRTSPLFSEDFSYPNIFRSYCKLLLDYISGEIKQSQEIFMQNFLGSAQTPLKKAVLLEAVEYVGMTLTLWDQKIEVLCQKIAISQEAKILGKHPKQWNEKLITLLENYQKYLRELIKSCGDNEKKQLQQESDSCLVLLSGIKQKLSLGQSWDEKKFFNTLNEQLVYQITQVALYDTRLNLLVHLKTLSLERLWKQIQPLLLAQLNIGALEKTKQRVEIERKKEWGCYQQLIEILQSNSSAKNSQHWKQQWLYGRGFPVCRFGGKSGITIKGFFHLSESIKPERFVVNEDVFANISSSLGSTYFSNDKSLTEESTLCLDANYQSDTAGATADGYGHFGSEELNRNVQQAAYRTVKLAVRYAHLYTDATSFYEDMPKLFAHIGQAVKQSFLHPEEVGTASCVLTKTFPQSDGKVMIVAGGIGDSMVMVWEPKSHQLNVLINPRQYNRGFQFTPISITETLEGEKMVQRTIEMFSADALLIRMTDGAWQLLSYKCSDKLLDKGANQHYLEYTLDTPLLEKKLHQFAHQYPGAQAKEYREFLQGSMQKTLYKQKSRLLQQQQAIQVQLKIFPIRSEKNTVEDFFIWAAKTNEDFYRLLTEFLSTINVSLESIKEISLLEFFKKMEKINIGDDITLHVEGLGRAINSDLSCNSQLLRPS